MTYRGCVVRVDARDGPGDPLGDSVGEGSPGASTDIERGAEGQVTATGAGVGGRARRSRRGMLTLLTAEDEVIALAGTGCDGRG